MSEQKDMILENFLSSAIRTLDTDEIYNILMDSLIFTAASTGTFTDPELKHRPFLLHGAQMGRGLF